MRENESKEILEKIYSDKKIFKATKDFESFAKKREFAPGYREKIEKNGIIGREIKVVGAEIVPLKEADLPLLLPDVDKYEPTGTEEGPLADVDFWVNVPCPNCGNPAKRETNTMPGWA